jgi:orotate phosphoribosyltransferase
MSWDVSQALASTGAHLEGHFLLSSGLHSGTYFQCAKLLAEPKHAKEVGEAIAELFGDHKVDCVVAPAIGGIVLSHVVAAALGVPSYFAERHHSQEFILRRGFHIEPGSSVLVVEDAITTGNSAQQVINLLEDMGAEVCGVGVIVQRRQKVGLANLKALVTIDTPAYTPPNCPLCRAGSTPDKLGSRPG